MLLCFEPARLGESLKFTLPSSSGLMRGEAGERGARLFGDAVALRLPSKLPEKVEPNIPVFSGG